MGPNDVGILRGIIGDGQSMNKEEMSERILGKKPNTGEKKSFLKFPPDKQQFANNHNSHFNPTQALEQFTGKGRANKSPMDTMNYFTGKGRVNTVSPTAALDYFIGRNNIRVDKFSRNAETKAQPIDTRTEAQKAHDRETTSRVNDLKWKLKNLQSQADKPTSEITHSKSKTTVPKGLLVRVATAQAQAALAEAEKRQFEAEGGMSAPADTSRQLVRLEGRTIRIPSLITSAEKSPVASAGDIWDTVKGVGGIVSGKQNVTATRTPVHFQTEYVVPTRSGLKDFAAGLAENLGSSIASGNVLIGPFEPAGGTAQIRNASRAYQAYVETLHKRHKTKGNSSLLQAKATEAERLKLEKLRGTIALKQQQVASAGFMGGQGGAAMLMSNVPRGNVNRFTELGGAFTRQSYGNYGPEASAQMGVGQGLRADQPNKWGVLLGQNAGTAKITEILGKKPDPMGETQAQKIQKLSVPMRSGEEAAAKIKRLSGM